MTYNVALSMIDVLARNDIKVVFGVPGGANSPFLNALIDRPEVRYINAAHECGAIFMAMGYARATGKAAAVFVTAGPGVTNCLTGVVSAFHEKLPVVVIAGEVSTHSFGKGAVQESNEVFHTVNTFRSCTRDCHLVLRPESAAALTQRAVEKANGLHPGPCVLSVPFNVSIAEIDTQELSSPSSRSASTFDRHLCVRAAALLKNAGNPLILAGAGCRQATESLVKLSERYGFKVATTPKGKGVFPEDHPNAVGVIGLGGHASANQSMVSGLDVVMAMGTSLDDLATNVWSADLNGSQGFIHVNSDLGAIGSCYKTDVAIVADVALVCDELTSMAFREPMVVTGNGRTTHQPEDYYGPLDGPLTAAVVDKYAPDNAIFTADMGEHLVAAIHHLTICKDRDWFIALGFGAMGSGPCSAVGLQLGAPEKPVFALVGDGGFLMLNELTTAVRLKVPLTYIIFNDGRLNMVHHGQQGVYGRTEEFATGVVDYAAYAKAFGAEGIVVKTGGQLGDVIGGPPAENRPRVIDARIDPAGRVPTTVDRAKGLKATLQGAH